MAATPANIPNVKAGESPPNVPDFTAGDTYATYGTHHDWTLGPTGARGWMWGWLLSTDLARQIYVTEVAAGSPAAQGGGGGVLKAGDVILGINGANFTSDARIALGKAITEAEKTANNGVLKLTRWRNGTTSTVTITLPVKGDYSALSPVSCNKSTAILQSAGQYIVNKGLSKDIQGYVNALGLLATGDAQYDTLLRNYARSLVPNTGPSSWNWDAAYMNLFLCEYYLAKTDAQVLPEINQLCLFLANGQSQVGSWGHAPVCPNQILGGYGALNSVGLVCAISLELGRKCGVNEPAVDQAVTKAATFFRRFVGCGTIPYGDHAPPQLHDDNGKSSMAAVFYDLIGEADACAYYSRLTVASYGLREMGHTGNYWSYLWGALGAQRSGDEASAAFLREQYWFHDLERRWDGGFMYQGGAGQTGSEHTTPGWDVTGARMLMYALPLKKLYITGKVASSAPVLGSADVTKTIASGSDFSYWYAQNKLTAEAYDNLTEAQLLARLDTWSCEERERAAKALSRKATQPIANYRTMIASANRDTILGGLCGLYYMGSAASPALQDVQPLLNHNDIWIQFWAGKVMCAIGGTARATTLPVVFGIASAAPDANDPRGFRKRFAAYNLWGNGWLDLSGFGLMRNFNGADLETLIPAVRKTMQHEHSVPRMYLAEWLDTLSFDQLEPYWFDIYRAVETQAPTAVMWNHESRDDCLAILARNNFKETVDAAATYVETMKNHGAENRMGQVMDVLVSFGTESQRVLPRLYAARTFYQNNFGPGKPYDFPQWATDQMMAALNSGITSIENATTAPANLKTIYDYSMYVLAPPSASPATVDPNEPTTLSVKVGHCDGLPITYAWSKVSGPGTVNFGSANATQTTATFSQAGTYQLQVTAQDAYRTKVLTLNMVVGGSLVCELGRLNLAANGGINPATGSAWRLGDTYRLVFVSSGTTTPASTNLATYDTFVQNLATAAGLGAGNWKMIGSNSTTNARDHTATNPNTNGSAEAIILIDGSTVIANNYADLWDGSIDAAINKTESGAVRAEDRVLTGTYNDGTKESDGRYLGGSGEATPRTTTGYTTKTASTWVRDWSVTMTESKPVYAISKVLQVKVSYPPTVDAGANQIVALSGGATRLWTPADMIPRFWVDASDASSITHSSGSVSKINDKSGNGYHLSQSTGTKQPKTGTRRLPASTGLNVLDCDGDDWLGSTASVAMPTSGNFSVFMVAGVDVVNNEFDSIFSIDHGSSTDLQLDAGIASEFRGRINWDTATQPSAGAVHAGPSIYNTVVDYSNTKNYFYVDGVPKIDATINKKIATSNQKLLAFANRGLNQCPDGFFAEMLVLDDVTPETRVKMEGYLAHKWGLASTLPDNPNKHAYRDAAPTIVITGAAASISGTVTDPDGGTPATTWSVVSGPGSVTFDNASAVNTTARFTAAGTYVLQLSAADPGGAVTDTVTVTVIDSAPSKYVTWLNNGGFANAFTDMSSSSNPDGDRRNNLLEFAFGTDPSKTDMGELATNGSRHGDPIVKAAGAGAFEFYFIRRKDHGTSGSLTYTPCFSSDLATFYDNNNTANPVVVASSSTLNADYEVLKVPFPSSLPNGQRARFAYVRVAAVP